MRTHRRGHRWFDGPVLDYGTEPPCNHMRVSGHCEDCRLAFRTIDVDGNIGPPMDAMQAMKLMMDSAMRFMR